MTDCTFIYFPIRGRAEADRIALELAGCKYTEENVHKDKWVEEKKKLLADGLLPFGQIPILKHKGKALVESMAILRYLGREYIFRLYFIRYKMYGDNDDDKWQIDMLVDGALDLRESYLVVTHTDAKDRAKVEKEFLTNKVPAWIGYFDKLKQKNAGDHFVGKKLSIADIAIFDILSEIDTLSKGAVKKNANLKKFLESFAAQPKYAEYRKSSRYHA